MITVHENKSRLIPCVHTTTMRKQYNHKRRPIRRLRLSVNPPMPPPPPPSPPAFFLTSLAECVAEFRAFVHGDQAGLARLAQVYPSILRYFNVRTDPDFYRVLYEARVPPHACTHWAPPSQLW
jgi:hypothetical protein